MNISPGLNPDAIEGFQLTIEELNVVKGQMNENKLLNTGYCFKSGEEAMVEFHVDDHDYFQAYADKKYPEFGGSVRIRAPPGVKPIIVFWNDEAIYNQNSTKLNKHISLGWVKW